MKLDEGNDKLPVPCAKRHSQGENILGGTVLLSYGAFKEETKKKPETANKCAEKGECLNEW